MAEVCVVAGRWYSARGTHPAAHDAVRALTVHDGVDLPVAFVWSEGQRRYLYLELARIEHELR
jgi:hypothetical protein